MISCYLIYLVLVQASFTDCTTSFKPVYRPTGISASNWLSPIQSNKFQPGLWNIWALSMLLIEILCSGLKNTVLNVIITSLQKVCWQHSINDHSIMIMLLFIFANQHTRSCCAYQSFISYYFSWIYYRSISFYPVDGYHYYISGQAVCIGYSTFYYVGGLSHDTEMNSWNPSFFMQLATVAASECTHVRMRVIEPGLCAC